MINIVIFYDPRFPIDGPRPKAHFFEHLNSHAIVSDADALEKNLQNDTVDCFVNLHGPYFPKHAWPAIYDHLANGKGFLHIGGAPFRIPCYQQDGEWKMERTQTAYHQTLNIHEVLPVRSESVVSLTHHRDIPVFAGKEDLFTIEDTHNVILHVTKASAIEAEMGSVG